MKAVTLTLTQEQERWLTRCIVSATDGAVWAVERERELIAGRRNQSPTERTALEREAAYFTKHAAMMTDLKDKLMTALGGQS